MAKQVGLSFKQIRLFKFRSSKDLTNFLSSFHSSENDFAQVSLLTSKAEFFNMLLPTYVQRLMLMWMQSHVLTSRKMRNTFHFYFYFF